MLSRVCLLAAAALVAASACIVSAQQVPASVSYQGKLTDMAGNPVPDGFHPAQFKLFTVEAGGSAFWTSAVVKLKTADGLFTTALGPITPATLSDKTDVWLETWVGDPLVVLTPRTKLVAAPFALRSGDLDLPFSGGVDTAGSAFRVSNLGTGNAVYGYSNSNYGYLGGTDCGVYGYAKSATYAVIGQNFSGGSGGYLGGVSEGVYGLTVSGDAGIRGDSRSSGNAVVAQTEGTGDAVHAYTSGPPGSNAGYFQTNNASNSSPTVYSTSNGSGAAVQGYATGTGEAGSFQISNATSPGNALVGFTNGSGIGVYAYNSGTGLGARIRTTSSSNPSHALHATAAGTGSAGYFENTNTASINPALYAETDGTSTTTAIAVLGFHSASGNYGYIGSGTYGVYGNVSGLSDTGVYGISAGNSGYGVWGYASYSAAGSANYGVRGLADGESGRGGYFVATGPYGRGIQASASNTGAYTNYGGHFTASGDYGIGIYARGASYAAQFSGNVKLTDYASGATVMELGTGLDYAEGFDVASGTKAAPGTVLVIDERNPGKLTVSTQANDRKVAGIVAGAKGLGSGVRLAAGQFDCDVALAGRVYCNVDAGRAAVAPGDLLTTSSVPGYAMKVTDHSRAQGAILGKAMEPLARGERGQILVLVTLQ